MVWVVPESVGGEDVPTNYMHHSTAIIENKVLIVGGVISDRAMSQGDPSIKIKKPKDSKNIFTADVYTLNTGRKSSCSLSLSLSLPSLTHNYVGLKNVSDVAVIADYYDYEQSSNANGKKPKRKFSKERKERAPRSAARERQNVAATDVGPHPTAKDSYAEVKETEHEIRELQSALSDIETSLKSEIELHNDAVSKYDNLMTLMAAKKKEKMELDERSHRIAQTCRPKADELSLIKARHQALSQIAIERRNERKQVKQEIKRLELQHKQARVRLHRWKGISQLLCMESSTSSPQVYIPLLPSSSRKELYEYKFKPFSVVMFPFCDFTQNQNQRKETQRSKPRGPSGSNAIMTHAL